LFASCPFLLENSTFHNVHPALFCFHSPFHHLAATNLIMGPLVVGMPRNKYKGAFSEETSPVSKLVGSSDDVGGGIQNTRIASLVADRLSHRLKLAVFVSCNLEGQTPTVPGCDGVMEQQMLRSRAGALAEREIGRILEEKLIKA